MVISENLEAVSGYTSSDPVETKVHVPMQLLTFLQVKAQK